MAEPLEYHSQTKLVFEEYERRLRHYAPELSLAEIRAMYEDVFGWLDGEPEIHDGDLPTDEGYWEPA